MTAHDPSDELRRRLEAEPFQHKFWSSIANIYGGGCWAWTRGRTSRGYGNVCLTVGDLKRWIPAHRIAYMLAIGPIPKGMQVCHRCDNRACCRPDHLFLGTNDDNVRDMVSKGRNKAGIAPVERRASGERHCSAKLTFGDVAMIRDRYAAGGITMKALGKEYGINPTSVFHIVHGNNWKHVPSIRRGPKGTVITVEDMEATG